MISITPVTRSMAQTGGTAAINTAGSGTWKASVSANWILLTSSSGTAGYPVGYTVSANNGVETRIGYVYVSGYTHTITQAGLGATLSAYSADFERAGGSGSVRVNAPSGKTWHAASNVDWITVSTTSGTGSRACSFTVAAYNEVSTRSGTLTIADNTFTVHQTGRRMQLKTTSATTDYFAGTIKIRVNALADTAWGVSVNADWLTVTDAGNGLGGDEVKVAVAENRSYNERSGVVTIGTETFTVTQLGRTSLVFRINPTEVAEFGVDGASGEWIDVTATPDLGWTASSSADWIELSSGYSSGSGSGRVAYKVKPNPTLYPRFGTITVTAADGGVAAKRLEISQAAAEASLTVESYEFEAEEESLTVGVNTGSIVGWNVINNTTWVSVSGLPTAGPAELTLTAAANTSVQPRSGTLIIADHEFRVSQKGRGVTVSYDETKVFDTDGKTTGEDSENIIGVVADPDVEWTAVASDPTWIVIYEGMSGKGNGTVKFIVAPYIGSGEIRTGMITIGDQIAYVTQRPYELSIEPNGAWVEGNAGAGEIQVALDIAGVWNAIATEPWITVVSGYNAGTGSGKVLFTYADNNTGKQRTGKIVINGEIYTLTQAARQNVAIAASIDGHGGHVQGGGIYNHDSAVELVAIPDDGYEFVSWTLSDGTTVATDATLPTTATDSVEYLAHFAALAPDIESVESSQSGVRLRWRNVAWATRYHVWRGTSPDRSQAEKIATLANDGTSEYSDASSAEDGDYWYWIEAEGMDEDLFGNAARGWRGKERFAITYENLRGTTHANPASYTVDDAFSFTPPSSRVGYTFIGWTPSGVVAGTASELTVRANWHQNEYAVHFDANGGTGSMEDETFTYGLWKYLTSNIFVRVGYAFAGWSEVATASSPLYSEGESVKNLTAEPNGIVTLYAQWVPDTYTVTFDRQSGSGGTVSVTATNGCAMPAITPPTRAGYTFGGYYTANGGTQYYTASGTSTRNWDMTAAMTLYAKWTAKTYTVTLNRQSGSGGTTSVTATYGSAMPSITVPTRTGYAFGGYYTSTGGAGTQYYTASGASARNWDKTAATTLYAKWTANTYAVTLDHQAGNGGTTSVTATYNSAMPKVTPPTRTGYTFGGYWTAANGGGTQYYTASGTNTRTWDKTAATTLYAKWTANTYTVTFDRQGGSGGTASVTATYGSAMPSSTVPTRAGYTFGGYWTGGGVSSGVPLAGLVAHYPFNGNTIDDSGKGHDLKNNGGKFCIDRFGNANLAVSFDGNEHYAHNPDTLLSEHSFTAACWFKTSVSKSSQGSAPSSFRAGNAVFFPDHGGNDAGVGLSVGTDGLAVTEHGSGYLPTKLSYNASIGTGWNHVCMVVENDTAVRLYLNGDLVASGNLSTKSKRFKVNVGGGLWGYYTGSVDDVCIYNRAISSGEVAQLYQAGLVNPICGTQYYTASGASARNWDMTADTTLYAKWTANTYTVTFDRQGGSGGSPSVTAMYGSAMPTVTVPTRTGYTFGGYFTAMNGGGTQYHTASGASARSWNKTSAATLYAKWTATTYTVKFNANGGKLPKGKKMAAQAFTYGTAAKLRKNVFTRQDYVFAGWAISKANAKKGVIAYVNAQNVINLRTDGKVTTLYAVWAKKTYTVAFYGTYKGVTGEMAVETFTYGKAKKLSGNKFKRKGYTFKGWAKSKADAKKGKVVYKNKKSVKNLTITGKTVKLYAVWEKK